MQLIHSFGLIGLKGPRGPMSFKSVSLKVTLRNYLILPAQKRNIKTGIDTEWCRLAIWLSYILVHLGIIAQAIFPQSRSVYSELQIIC